MHWWSFAILAYLAIAVQLGVGGGVLAKFAPNLPMLACLFVALHARTPAALLGAITIGFGHDLISGNGLGAYAFFYALLALFVVQARDVVYRRHPFTHVVLTALSGAGVCIGMEAREVLRAWIGFAEPAHAFWMSLTAVGISTLIVVPLFAVLQRYRVLFGFPDARND